MTPLRNKMLEELRLRNMAVNTQRTYVYQVARFARHFGACPSTLGPDEVRRWMLHLQATGRSPATRSTAHAALRFLYVETLRRPEVMAQVPRPRLRRAVVNPLLRSEAAKLVEAATADIVDEALVLTLLGTGLRNAEVRHLRVGDIDRPGQLVHVRHGKGGKARCVPLDDRLYDVLRRYWRACRPPGPWVFPAQRPGVARDRPPHLRWADKPIGPDSLRRRLHRTATRAGIQRRVTPHDLRRTYATWLVEAATPINVVQALLGHSDAETTVRYTRVRPEQIRQVLTPLSML